MEPMASEGGEGCLPVLSAHNAAKLHVANMMRLCKDLRLPVAFKVHEECMEPQATGNSPGKSAQLHARKFVVIVHVQSDFAFKKYLDNCSNSDLMLYRGLLLEVTTVPDVSSVLGASVRQAFLPKFETEDKDTSIANCIVNQASERAMVITIKHSGSLVTLSGKGFAAKNSVNNAFTAGAQTLLQAHFARVFGAKQGPIKLASLMELLRARRMAVSFEMVTGSHGHHGQLPAAEYLVTTAAHTLDTDTAKPIFLTWLDFLQFCVEQHLPVNNTWLLAGCEWAAAARDVLDYQALNGGLTAPAVMQLNKLIQDGASSGCLHLPGTYPHHQWQGSRLEGFVVAQGQPVNPEMLQALRQLQSAMASLVLPLETIAPALRSPYQATLLAKQAAAAAAAAAEEGSIATAQADAPSNGMTCQGETHVKGAEAHSASEGAEISGRQGEVLKPVDKELGQQVVGAVRDAQFPGLLMRTPSGNVLVSRSELSRSSLSTTCTQLQQLLLLHSQPEQGMRAADPEALQKILGSLEELSSGNGGDVEAALETMPGLRQPMARTPRAMIGCPDIAHTLRYKKKMLMWSAPTPSRTNAKRKATDPADPAAGEAAGSVGIRAASADGAAADAEGSKRSKPNTHAPSTLPAGQVAAPALDVAAQPRGGGTANGIRGAAGDQADSAQGAADGVREGDDGGSGGVGCPKATDRGPEGMDWEGVRLAPPAAAPDSTVGGVQGGPCSTNSGGPGSNSSSDGVRVVSSDAAVAAEAQAAEGGVGYCMLTFIIRNGLHALKLGLPTYLAYCASQAEKLGLGRKQKAQVDMFARTWARWIGKRGGASVVNPWSYLDHAEPFVQDFLGDLAAGSSGGGLLSSEERPRGAFQGLLVLVDVAKPKALALQSALHAAHLLEATELPPFSKALVSQGTLILMPAGSPAPKQPVLSSFFTPAGGSRQVYVYVEALSPEIESSNTPDAKKIKGMRTGKLKAMEILFKGPKDQPSGKGKQKQQQQPQKQQQQQQDSSHQQQQQQQQAEQAWQSRVQCAAQEKSVEEIVQWVGPGAPLPPADPAAILCFLSIPATGKSAIANALQPPHVHSTHPVQLKVLSSDSMKGKGMPANRYWHDVAAAADSNLGNGSRTAVIADKNLVLHPRENVERNASVLKDSGAVAVAVLPVCSGTSSATTQPQLYADLPRLPFPLELLALCMLRTIKRKGHTGNLDAQAPNPLSVMASFATFFKHSTHKELLKYLRTHFHIVAELPIMEAADNDPQRQVPAEVLQHIAAGVELALMQKIGSELSPEQLEWERKARSLLQQPEVEQRLLRLQRPLQDCCSDLQGIINASLQRAQQPASAVNQVAQESDACWVAVTGFETSALLEAARQVLPPGMCAQLKDELHVTLWHPEDPVLGTDQELQQCILAAVGSEVAFEVTHIDFVPEGMAAAKVQLTSAPDTVLAKLSGSYLHITLVVGPSGQAKDAKLLGQAVAQRSSGAQRHALPGPLPLVGQLLAVQKEW